MFSHSWNRQAGTATTEQKNVFISTRVQPQTYAKPLTHRSPPTHGGSA
ncbi:uncharacterized protein CCOS01_12138 [Colletotrichum costaricense]|uniref:Uncharacterized protein n=1 Tax=Colletotrichum costaricense TaxID=1209916 RepID=A0AAI9YNY6_9PEZI|nr:uncharacterized protein CCOS01_12138 [Colletotrichum costaricense]KAK1517881.1 hypothetical protein CCOS01_12138 [Colletotrichum costaricense]